MVLLASILVVAVLLGGFLFLTAVEKKSGRRMLAPLRARLDVYADGMTHHARKFDGKMLMNQFRIIGAYIVHEFVHAVLIAVRALERLLTQTVRALRSHHSLKPTPHGETTGKVE